MHNPGSQWKKEVQRVSPLPGLLGSLADETRLRLLRILERHELGVVELCDVLQLPQSTVSRHLKILADEKWVRSQRRATANLYRLALDELDLPQRQLWLLAREQTDDWATADQDRLRLARRLQEKRKDSQTFFAGAAAEWDRLREELYGDQFSTIALLSLLPADAVIADLGCGTGQMTARLAEHVGRVIGVDDSTEMLAAARQRVEQLPNVELRPGELDDLPIDRAACNAALLVLALSYVPEAADVLREAARVLKPGGKVVIVDLLPHDRDDFRRQLGQRTLGFSREWVLQSLVDAGLSDPVVRPLMPAPASKGPALFVATATRRA